MTNKEQFESEMNALANSINEKAGSTGAKTISQLKTAVDSIVTGGTEVIANPTLVGTEDALTGLQVGDTKYKVDSGISQADADTRYLQLTGGTLSGTLIIKNIKNGNNHNVIDGNSSNLVKVGHTENYGEIQLITGASNHVYHNKGGTNYIMLDTSTGLALAGGTMIGNIKLNNNAAKIVDNTNLRVIEANNSSLYIGDTTSDVAVFTGNWDVRHIKNNASYNMLDTSNTSANPGNTTASLTSLKLNGTNYAIAGGTQVTFVDWS